MKDTVVVFTRAPRLGAVKRRLARDIGDRAALRFHVATMTRLVRALAADRRFRTVVAVTPDRARLSLPVKQIPQGSGDLGMRMHRALGRYRCGRVAIIGCDIPEAGPRDLLAAFRALGSADAVFGPATDGGYWLVAITPAAGAAFHEGAMVNEARSGRYGFEFYGAAYSTAACVERRGYC